MSIDKGEQIQKTDPWESKEEIQKNNIVENHQIHKNVNKM